MNLRAKKFWTFFGLLVLGLSVSAETGKRNEESLLKPRIVGSCRYV